MIQAFLLVFGSPHFPPGFSASILPIAASSLIQLQGRIGITRRWLRLFRFLGSFRSGWVLYLSEGKSVDIWLDVLAKSSLGMYGLLESATLLDLIGIDDLAIFGPAQTRNLNREAQLFWFVALYTSVLSHSIRLMQHLTESASKGPNQNKGSAIENPDGSAESKRATAEGQNEVEVSLPRLKQHRAASDTIQTKSDSPRRTSSSTSNTTRLYMKLMADILDMVLPAVAVGWIRVDTGFVGLAMIGSTAITGLEIWEKCGEGIKLQGK